MDVSSVEYLGYPGLLTALLPKTTTPGTKYTCSRSWDTMQPRTVIPEKQKIIEMNPWTAPVYCLEKACRPWLQEGEELWEGGRVSQVQEIKLKSLGKSSQHSSFRNEALHWQRTAEVCGVPLKDSAEYWPVHMEISEAEKRTRKLTSSPKFSSTGKPYLHNCPPRWII